MIRQPTYAGKIKEKDDLDILFWANEKTPFERLAESWRLNCMNHGIPTNTRMIRTFTSAIKR